MRFRLLPEILRHSDIVSLHVPLNASTQHMIGARELAPMKPSAIIVNTSRGPVIDEKAMTAALSAGKLFGAGLDVFDEEPTPPDNPLLKLDNVDPDGASRRPDLREQHHPPAQRLRQRPARGARRARALGRARDCWKGVMRGPSRRGLLAGGARGPMSRPPGCAQSDWPKGPVRWVVAFAAGGAADTVARNVGARVSEILGQHVIIDNRTGGNSLVAAETP